MDLSRLQAFLENNRPDQYLPTFDHIQWVTDQNQLTALMLFELTTKFEWEGKKVLEVGFGEGFMLEQFRERLALPAGIGLDENNHQMCLGKGLDVYLADQSFMEFPDNEFDLLWSQHVLEHSLFPFFTLHEYKRVMKPGAIAYVELPGPDNDIDENYLDDLNHYCVMTKNMWLSLMRRAGFKIIDSARLELWPIQEKERRASICQYSIILKKEEEE